MKVKVFSGVAVLTAVLLTLCQKSVDKEGALAKIGNDVVTQQAFDAFKKMQRLYPTGMEPAFPGKRSPITFLVETEVIYDKAKSSPSKREVESSLDWSWKKKFFPAQLYLTEMLDKNLGFSNEELESWYSEHKDQFQDTVTKYDTIKVDIATSVPDKDTDTAKTLSGTKDSLIARDSVMYRKFVEVKSQVAEKLFGETYQPTDDFIEQKKAERDSADTTELDKEQLARDYYYAMRNNLPDFFMKQYYRDKYGEEMPDSLSEWYGKGKPVTPQDIEMILMWLPEYQREDYRKDSSRIEYLAKWLLKWKLFSEKARQSGFAVKSDARTVVEWARKVDVVQHYVKNEMMPKAEEAISVDTMMARFAYYDDQSRVPETIDSGSYNSTLRLIKNRQIEMTLDKQIYQMRSNKDIEFLQPDFKDDKVKDPGNLLAQADSVRDSGQTKEAENLYKMLAASFPFADQGIKAFSELAKIQTEKEYYRQAIDNYRRFLLNTSDPEKRCNTFFMIGFIYDEYMSKPELAEAQYKWILKHMPDTSDCELADDAEFMALHLDEPMTSIEELGAEARRQGRIVEDAEPIDESAVEVIEEDATES
ncbi:MAG: hypothetical protein GF398_13375 [Chitinivibrionales bacterium]|nr:hypothetical protein [Chitinivibrionales bacterium]